MKKRRILFAAIISVLSLTISACDFLPSDLFNNNKSQESSQRSRPSRNPSSSTKEHVHKFSEEWSYNSQAHWHDATCGHTVKSELGSHQFYSVVIKEPTCSTMGTKVDMCTICDYQQTVYLEKTDHNWHEYNRIEPTCYESGVSKRFCTTCGVYEDLEIPALGHDFVATSYVAPTCSQVGYSRMTCTRCGETYDYTVPKSNHVWSGNEYYQQGYDGNMSYCTDTCIYCGASMIKLRTNEAALSGSYKSGIYTDYGYTKLGSNGSSLTFTFDYPYAAYGTMYQHGFFDNWRTESYRYVNYHYMSSSMYEDYGNFNFAVNVNGQMVDMFESAQIPYYQFFENGTEIPEFTNNGYSPVADCLIGDFSLNPGINTITYTRQGSFNLTIDSLVLVIQNSDHVHTVSNYWSYDDNYHWHNCTDVNCPISGARLDSDVHSFISQTIVEPTCHQEGIRRDTCTVCGFVRDTYLPQTDHDYQSVGSFDRSLETSVLLDEYGCQYCGLNVLRWSALDYDQTQSTLIDTSGGNNIRFQTGSAENLNGEPVQGSHIIYNLELPVSLSNVGLAFNITQSSGSAVFDVTNSASSSQGYVYDAYGNLTPATKKFGLRVNGVEIALGDDPYGTVSANSNTWFNWPVNFNLCAGINTIDIYCLCSSYRARMYEFQLTNIPYIEPTHVHTPDNVLQYDSQCHFYACVNGDGVRFNEEPHQFGDYVTVSEATCVDYGQQVRTCLICGYEEYSSLYPHGHNFDQYITIQEPTCTQEGIQEATCTLCGITETFNLSPYGHQWDDGVVTVSPTHTDPGERLYACLVCGEQMVENIPAGHNWGDTIYVGAENESQVGYYKRQCQDDGVIELDIRALDGSYSGGVKYMGNDYVRLSTNGTTMSYTFNFDRHAIGKLYIRGAINSFSSNQGRPFYYSDTSYSSYNFEVAVNGTIVGASEGANNTFYDMLKDGEVDSTLSTAYSPVANCLIGDIELVNGENTINYTKLSSYNLYMSDLILVVEGTSHVHTPSSSYSFDQNYHWQCCADADCPAPNTVLNKQPHNFIQAESSDQPGCCSESTNLYICRDCGYQKEVLEYNEHSFEGTTSYINNSDGYEVSVRYCNRCCKSINSMYFNQGIVMSGSYEASGKLKAGTSMSWKMPVFQTGWASIYLPCKMTSGNTGQTFNPSLYVITVNNLGLDILVPSGTYDELGITSTETRYFQWAQYYVSEDDVRNGEIEIVFTSNNSNYRMIFDGEIRLEYQPSNSSSASKKP